MPTELVVNGCCPLDCQDTCAWTATVVDGRVVKVSGVRAHPLTRGVLCAKVKDYEARTYATDRLLEPMIRTGEKGEGSFRRASWDEALDLIASRWLEIFTEYGPESLLPVHGLQTVPVLRSTPRVNNLRKFASLLPPAEPCRLPILCTARHSPTAGQTESAGETGRGAERLRPPMARRGR